MGEQRTACPHPYVQRRPLGLRRHSTGRSVLRDVPVPGHVLLLLPSPQRDGGDDRRGVGRGRRCRSTQVLSRSCTSGRQFGTRVPAEWAIVAGTLRVPSFGTGSVPATM